ncbi:MAG TPA: class I tRNA ligase family protein [Polyangiaceae bacterium]|nr:class I tRNA ligase family protein [Polyangiaceae bacterium]
MTENTATAGPPQTELLVTSRDVEAGRVRRESDVAVHRCPDCDTELSDRYHFDCPECGREGRPSTRCRGCGGELEPRRVRYVAEGPRGNVAKSLSGVYCPACDVKAVEELELDALDALAELAVGSVELLPESGIFSSERLEVLADADVCGAGEPERIEKRRGGMVLRIGEPSALFEAALGVVTEQDPQDIFSPTLSVEPGPPYTAEQRHTFHLLLAAVQRELGAPVSCWSASVGLSEEPLVDPVLSEQLIELADGGHALALYHAIASSQAPGRFVGSVRLLARALGVAADGDVTGALRARLRSLEAPPLDILQRLWRAMHPGSAFDEERVYDSMCAFHARYSAPDAPESGPRLPWEEPDYEGYAAWLRRLVSVLLDTPALDP